MRNLLVTILCITLSVTAGGKAVAQETVDDPGSSPAVPEEVETDLPVGPLLLGSFGAVFVAVGAGFGWQAKQENDDFNERASDPQPGGALYPKASDDLADDIRAHSIAANVLMLSGVAAMAGGLVWWLLDRSEGSAEIEASTKEKRVSLIPLVGPGHAGLSVEF